MTVAVSELIAKAQAARAASRELRRLSTGAKNAALEAMAAALEANEESLLETNGLEVLKVRVPLGVIGTIYEARRQVPVDVSALCIKSGNAVVLRGGKEAIHTNTALGRLIRQTLAGTSVPADAVQVIESTDRALVAQRVKLRAPLEDRNE